MNPYYDPYQGMSPLGLTPPTPGAFSTRVSPSVRVTGQQPGAPTPGDVNLAGATPLTRRDRAKQFASSALEQARSGLQLVGSGLQAIPTGRLGFAGGLISPALTAIEEAQAGRPTGAAAALAGGAAGAAAGAGLARFIPGPLGKVAQVVLPTVGGMIGAPTAAAGAESTRQRITGEPTKGKEGEFPTQLAISRQLGELGTTQYRDQMGVYTSAMRDLSKYYADQEYINLQRNVPIINQLKNAELTRQQALMNTQGQLQGMLGVLATGGALAQGAQAETGATLRTALTAAPYAGSVLQAPNISFG